MSKPVLFLIAAALAVNAASLAAASPGGQVVIDRDRADDCNLTIANAGRAFVVQASGLIPGESYRFTLTNGNMRPVDFAGYADGSGRLEHYYAPFRFGQPGGVVRVRLAAANCALAVSAPWTRSVPVIR